MKGYKTKKGKPGRFNKQVDGGQSHAAAAVGRKTKVINTFMPGSQGVTEKDLPKGGSKK